MKLTGDLASGLWCFNYACNRADITVILMLVYLCPSRYPTLYPLEEHRSFECGERAQVAMRDRYERKRGRDWGRCEVSSDELQGCPKPHAFTAIGTNSTTVAGAQFRHWIRRYCRWHCNWLPNESPTSPKSSKVTLREIGTVAPSV